MVYATTGSLGVSNAVDWAIKSSLAHIIESCEPGIVLLSRGEGEMVEHTAQEVSDFGVAPAAVEANEHVGNDRY